MRSGNIAGAMMLLTLAASAAGGAFDLDAYRWHHRLLIAFVPEPPGAAYQAAVRALDHHGAALLERDLRVIVVRGVAQVSEGGQTGGREAARALRARFGVDGERLVFVLIGKDGGEKARQHDALDLAALFTGIDAMPMRRREVE